MLQPSRFIPYPGRATYPSSAARRTLGTENTLWLKEVLLENGTPRTGETSVEFQERLLEYCFARNWFNAIFQPGVCGWLGCVLNGDPATGRMMRSPQPVKRGNQTAWFGSAEIRVIGDGMIYAASTIIYHWVVEHQYRPPDEIIEAVLKGPRPGTEDYWEQLEALSGPGPAIEWPAFLEEE